MKDFSIANWVKVAVVFAGIVIIVGSLATYKSASHTSHEHHGIIDKIYAADSVQLPENESSVAHLPPLDTHHVSLFNRDFFVPNREKEMVAFPCSNCHTEDMAAMKKELGTAEKIAHWNREIHHAGTDVMNCQTCHQTNSDHLISLTGKPIAFNNSFELCGQCHQSEQKDWAGGAHGKRIGGWAKPVVRQTCVGCHDPHDPGFKSQMPERVNSTMIEQRKVK